jgi:hypothetical protein
MDFKDLARRLAGACVLAACAHAQAQAPSTFGTVIGGGIMCRDHVANHYFYSYLKGNFDKPYKRDGGAWWFRAPEAQLWGFPVVELMVSDESYPYSFVGAVVDAAPDKLEEAIRLQDPFSIAPDPRYLFMSERTARRWRTCCMASAAAAASCC